MATHSSSLIQGWNKLPKAVHGQTISTGIAEGVAFNHAVPTGLNLTFNSVVVKEIFHKITSRIEKELNAADVSQQHKEFLDMQSVFFSDSKFHERIFSKLAHSTSLQTVLDEVFYDLKQKFCTNVFWQNRLAEFQSMTLNLVEQEISNNFLLKPFDYPTILVTQWINPDKLINLSNLNVKGLILINSSELSHLSIFVKSLDMPVLGIQSEYAKNIQTGDPLLINGREGLVHIHPNSYLINTAHKENKVSKKKNHFAKKEPLKSLDGESIELSINVNIFDELQSLDQEVIKGIGLFRSEFPFILKGRMLSLQEQVNLYKNMYNQSKQKPLYFRTLDISGDKILPLFENNFNLQNNKKINSWQSTRVAVDRPLILRHQIRALLKARTESNYPHEPIFIMFPMISNVEELLNAKKLVNAEEEYFKKHFNQHLPKIYIGVVIEVPSLVYQLDKIITLIDFATVGSNDLFHFFYATNRYDPYRKNQHDILSVSFLSYLKSINDLFKAHSINLCLCGEMAGSSLEAMALLSQGFKHFSISPVNLEKIYNMIKSCNIDDLEKFYASFEENAAGMKAITMNVRQHLIAYAKSNNIPLD